MSQGRVDGPIVSHGRGGAANIKPDKTPYTDASIVREGPVGDQGDGPYSSGRGGQGNIGGSPRVRPQNGNGIATGAGTDTGAGAIAGKGTGDRDYVPELNVKQAPDNFHIGRGGEGNVHMDGNVSRTGTINDGKSYEHPHEGAAQRLKDRIFRKDEKA